MKTKFKKNLKFIIPITFIICIFVAFCIYTGIYYKSNDFAKEYLKDSENVKVNIKSDYISFEPNETDTAIIFYPGGKVEYSAYAPLMHELAKNNILCIIVKMPFNLAVFGMNNANKIFDEFKDINNWYIAGHSLGGAMASGYISNHTDDFKGLILLAAYSTYDLTNSNLKVLSIYGSNDKVMNKDNYIKYKDNLPSDSEEYIISGGIHAYFGSYGFQKGDGSPDISIEKQTEETVNKIIEFIK